MAELKYLVDQVLSDNKEKFFTQKQIREEVKKLKNEEGSEYAYSINSIQPTVSKRLKELLLNGTVIKIGKEYAYKTTKNIHHIVRGEICSKVTFFKENVYVMSQNMIAVPVNGTTVSIAKELFKDYYGDEGLYDAMRMDDYLLLMLNVNATDMSINEIAKDLNEIIHNAKQFDNDRQEIRRQLQYARAIKEVIKYAKMPGREELPEYPGKTDDWDEIEELYGSDVLEDL